MLVTDMSVQDIVATVNAMRGMDVDGIYSANLPSYADDTYIDGVSYVFVYEDELKEMMERVDAGKDPKGPNTMGLSDSSSALLIGDLNNNTCPDDYANVPQLHGSALTIPMTQAIRAIRTTTKSPPATATATKPTTGVTRFYQTA